MSRTDDTISRKAAIEALGKEGLITAMVIIDRVPSSQSVARDMNVLSKDLISRQAAIDALTDQGLVDNMDSVNDTMFHKTKRAAQRILAGLPSAQPSFSQSHENDHSAEVSKMVAHPEPCEDAVSRKAAIDALEEPRKVPDTWTDEYAVGERMQWERDVKALNSLPSAQPEQDVLVWLLAYHTKSFELHGRYFPHEVISWLVNDFSKEFIAERREE